MSHCFFFNDTATTEIYTLSLHDALPIWARRRWPNSPSSLMGVVTFSSEGATSRALACVRRRRRPDRKSTRLNSSHANISYAVFCLKKKKRPHPAQTAQGLPRRLLPAHPG